MFVVFYTAKIVYICVFITCSTPYCLCDTLMNPWNIHTHEYIYIYIYIYTHTHTHTSSIIVSWMVISFLMPNLNSFLNYRELLVSSVLSQVLKINKYHIFAFKSYLVWIWAYWVCYGSSQCSMTMPQNEAPKGYQYPSQLNNSNHVITPPSVLCNNDNTEQMVSTSTNKLFKKYTLNSDRQFSLILLLTTKLTSIQTEGRIIKHM
jgi:hypothetical protein